MKRQPQIKLRFFKVDDSSQNKFFSASLSKETGVSKIGPEESFWKGWRQWQRILRPIPDCSEIWARFVKELLNETKGKAIVADIRPEHAAFYKNQYETALANLDNQLKKRHLVSYKVGHPTKRMRWDSEELIPYQYVFDVDEFGDVQYIMRTFNDFEMGMFLILKPSANLFRIAEDLKVHFLEQRSNLDEVFDEVVCVVYFNFDGTILVVESERSRFNSVLATLHKLQREGDYILSSFF